MCHFCISEMLICDIEFEQWHVTSVRCQDVKLQLFTVTVSSLFGFEFKRTSGQNYPSYAPKISQGCSRENRPTIADPHHAFFQDGAILNRSSHGHVSLSRTPTQPVPWLARAQDPTWILWSGGKAGLEWCQGGSETIIQRFEGLVASRLWPLRWFIHPHGVACDWNIQREVSVLEEGMYRTWRHGSRFYFDMFVRFTTHWHIYLKR